jgi:hypothetical protein
MGGARLAIYALLLLVLAAVAAWRFQASGEAASQDADTVYCLAPAHLDGFVRAAVSLGLAEAKSTPATMYIHGHKLTFSQWRAADNGDFEQACDAYATAGLPASAAASPATGIGAVLGVLLPVIAGALLTMAADDFKQDSDRRWVQAGELRNDWQAFDAAVRSYLAARQQPLAGGLPSSADLDAKRRILVATLLKIHSQHRRSPTIGNLQKNLSGDLGTSIVDNWDDGDTTKIRARATKITDCLSECESSLEKVAGALEHRVWLSFRL